ncbi:ABC transporter permease [Spirochaetia bacterium]|nr:ABC transporter permease [Spirochaetia bacterium]
MKKVKPEKKLTKRVLRSWLHGYMFLLPWLVGVFLLVLYPLINSLRFSFFDVRITPRGMVFIPAGLTHYRNMFVVDLNFLQMLATFLVSTFLQTIVIVPFALIIAIMLNQKIKLRGLFRSIYFLPVIIATGPVMNELVTQGVATVPMMNSAAITQAISAALPVVLADPIISLFSQLITILWNSGVQILIFLAGLQKVDPAQYEAAKIDGGSGWECFWKITLPSIMPMIFLNAIYTVVILATSGNNAIIVDIKDAMFQTGQTGGYGYASAEAWVYSLSILFLLGIVWLLLHDKKEKVVGRRWK